MFRKKYHVISPDGFPITHEPFKSRRAALKFIPQWCERFQHQGYYSTSGRERIPLEELPDYLSILPADEVIMTC
jgi:hypothetical protein